MIALDTNLLVYAHRSDAEHHERAIDIVNTVVSGPDRFALPWTVVHEFLGAVTSPAKFERPTPARVACRQMDRLIGRRTTEVIGETPDHWPLVRELIEAATLQGRAVYDARIAATCLAHRVTELWTADRDFGRFPALKTKNPLVE